MRAWIAKRDGKMNLYWTQIRPVSVTGSEEGDMGRGDSRLRRLRPVARVARRSEQRHREALERPADTRQPSSTPETGSARSGAQGPIVLRR
jgi:hypothetical protein